MGLHERLAPFVRRIRPTDEHVEEANRQTDWMIQQLQQRVADDGSYALEKVLKAGSNAKFTSLLRTEDNIFDADMGAYFSGKGASRDRLSDLLQFLRRQLRDIYPQKSESEFIVLNSAVRVQFKSGIELWVDVAPIIADPGLRMENGGWIPRSDGEWRLTSVTLHNEFVHSRTARSKKVSDDVHFNRIVRLAKWWNNLQDDPQPTFVMDLLTAAAFDTRTLRDDWPTMLRETFVFWLRHGLTEPIVFADYYDPRRVTIPTDTVVLLDPVNPENNITRGWTPDTRDKFLDRIQLAYDRMAEARMHELDGDEDGALDLWSEVFGPKFLTLSEPED